MKKVFIAVLLIVGLTSFAQEGKKKDSKRSEMEKLSPEQKKQLHLKKLTLELGLNESQQKEIGKIMAEQSGKREVAMAERKANMEKGVKPSADERFAKQNKRLDEEMVVKEKVKKILTPEQFAKWEDMRHEKREKMENKREKKEEKREEMKEKKSLKSE